MSSPWQFINANYKNLDGYKRVAWPPPSEERVLREFTPQPMPQYQTVPSSLYNQTPQQQQQYQASYQYPQHQEQHNQTAAAPTTQSQFRSSSYDNYRQTLPHIPQQQQQQQAPQQQQKAYYPTSSQPTSFQNQQTQSLPYQVSVQAQQQYQQPTSWAQYQRYQQQSQQAIPDPYQRPLSKDQIDNVEHHQQQQPYLSQDYRGGSPGIIQLRKEAPVTQKPIPVYTSQPATIGLMGGANMRGDLKWPPPEYKEAAARENEERRKIAMGPACRPRRIQRDYTAFFAKNALSHHYPSYKVPPGTQHIMV